VVKVHKRETLQAVDLKKRHPDRAEKLEKDVRGGQGAGTSPKPPEVLISPTELI